MRLFDDCPYVVDKSRSVKFGTKAYRCLCIDVNKAIEMGLNLEGFVNNPGKESKVDELQQVTPWLQ